MCTKLIWETLAEKKDFLPIAEMHKLLGRLNLVHLRVFVVKMA